MINLVYIFPNENNISIYFYKFKMIKIFFKVFFYKKKNQQQKTLIQHCHPSLTVSCHGSFFSCFFIKQINDGLFTMMHESTSTT